MRVSQLRNKSLKAKAMKLLATYCLLMLFIACNSSEEKKDEQKDSIESSQTTKNKKETAKNSKTDIFLPQKGDYSILFSKQECNTLITAEELSNLIGKQVTQDSYGCNFIINKDEATTNRINFLHQKFPKANVVKEIKNYIKDAPFIYQELSASGDTYLCHQPAPGRLLIFNPNYANTIVIKYTKRNADGTLDKPNIEENKNFAVKAANFLIKKHSK